MQNISCSVTKINRTNDMYDFDLFLKRGVKFNNYFVSNFIYLFCYSLFTCNIFLQIRVSLLLRNDHEFSYRPFLGISNYSVDICAYNSGRLASILMDMVISDVKKYTNFFRPCPISVMQYFVFCLIICMIYATQYVSSRLY